MRTRALAGSQFVMASFIIEAENLDSGCGAHLGQNMAKVEVTRIQGPIPRYSKQVGREGPGSDDPQAASIQMALSHKAEGNEEPKGAGSNWPLPYNRMGLEQWLLFQGTLVLTWQLTTKSSRGIQHAWHARAPYATQTYVQKTQP